MVLHAGPSMPPVWRVAPKIQRTLDLELEHFGFQSAHPKLTFDSKMTRLWILSLKPFYLAPKPKNPKWLISKPLSIPNDQNDRALDSKKHVPLDSNKKHRLSMMKQRCWHPAFWQWRVRLRLQAASIVQRCGCQQPLLRDSRVISFSWSSISIRIHFDDIDGHNYA